MAIAGAGVQWLRDNLGIIKTSAEVEPLAASVPDTAGVYFVPAFSGGGTSLTDAPTQSCFAFRVRAREGLELKFDDCSVNTLRESV